MDSLIILDISSVPLLIEKASFSLFKCLNTLKTIRSYVQDTISTDIIIPEHRQVPKLNHSRAPPL